MHPFSSCTLDQWAKSAPPSYVGSPFIHSCKSQRSFGIVIVIYNMVCAHRAFVMANIKEKYIQLNAEYFIQFIHVDINNIKIPFIINVIMQKLVVL